MITLYVLRSTENGRRYVGITKDLERRIAEHRSGYTKAGQTLDRFDVLHTETFPDYKSARFREKELKSGKGREWLDMTFPTSRPASGG